MVAPFSKFAGKFVLVFILTLESASFRRFNLKQAERAQVLLKYGTRDFQDSPLFERWAYFSVAVGKDFKRFQNFEADFLENENIFKKTGVQFFS